MLKCGTDVSPIAGKGKNKTAALSSAYLQGVTRVCQGEDLPLHRRSSVTHVTQDGKENLPSCWAGRVHPPLSVVCWLTGTAALLHTWSQQEGEQNFLRINSIKNTSELKFLHSKLNPYLPKVQGCSGLRLSFSHVSGDLRNPFTLQREKQEAETVSPPGPFLQLSWLLQQRLFWLQAQTGGTFLCSLVFLQCLPASCLWAQLMESRGCTRVSQAHRHLELACFRHLFYTQVLIWAKQTTECFFKRRTESWPILSLALVPCVPGGLNIQVIRVYQQKNSQNRTTKCFLKVNL